MNAWEEGVTLPTLRALLGAPNRPAVDYIGPLDDHRLAREWALVLQSQSIAYTIESLVDGWAIRVAAHEYPRAIEAIDAYEVENESWPPPRKQDHPRHDSSPVVVMALLGMVMFFLYVTGPAALGSSWFMQGRADAQALFSEPWRMVTALTLHADAQHVIGNAISGSIFGTMLARRIGAGGALLAMLVAGAAGNALNALHHLPGGHLSIGASTAVFAAVGILAAVQLGLDWGRRAHRQRYGMVDVLAPVIGGLALLGTLGAGRHTDLWAHGFGFLAGVLLGGAIAWLMRARQRPPSPLAQAVALLAAAALLGASWAAAMSS